MTTYPGGKNACYHQIINRIPPHDCYVELFLGSGAIMRMKRPALINVGVEVDTGVLVGSAHDIKPGAPIVYRSDEDQFSSQADNSYPPIGFYRRMTPARPGGYWLFYAVDALRFLTECPLDQNCMIYADPPYVRESRRNKDRLYSYEFTDGDHRDLIRILKQSPAQVMISGYPSELYSDLLAGWRCETFTSYVRGGRPATECLWMNYPEPVALHDYRYLGQNFRARERITRQKKRWIARLERMDKLQRQAMLWAMDEFAARQHESGDTPEMAIADPAR